MGLVMFFPVAQADPNSVSTFIVLIGIGMAIFGSIVVLAILLFFVRPWLRAFLSGAPISMFQIVGMRFRGSPINEILEQGIAVRQAGHPVSWVDLERVAISGVDLQMIADAYCVLRQRGEHYSFDELVLAARESRLDKLIK